jgi:hypothetical protein
VVKEVSKCVVILGRGHRYLYIQGYLLQRRAFCMLARDWPPSGGHSFVLFSMTNWDFLSKLVRKRETGYEANSMTLER